MTNSITINPTFRAVIPPLAPEELAQLEQNLLADGCRDPLVTWTPKLRTEGSRVYTFAAPVLIDGHNRYDICTKHGLKFKTTSLEFDDEQQAMVWIIRNQFGRRNLSPFTRVELALKLEPLLREKAKENQAHGATAPGKKSLLQNSAEALDTRQELARVAGVSHDTIAKGKLVAEHADEETKQKLRAGLSSINEAASEVKQKLKQEKKQQLAMELNAKPLPQPDGPFDVIVCDPPWKYESRAEDITHRGRLPYPDMTVEQICSLPVSTLAEPNCILWLWTTNAFMRQAFRVLDAWGFEEKTILTWCKDRMGVGDWLRGQTEHCILAVRGKPFVTLTNQTTVLNGPLREHSRKPDEFFALVDALCHGRKLEMFARETRNGWAAWGAEKCKF